jgi:hypothetical protein
MMEKQKAPGIIKKYGLPVDLRSQLPYGKVEQYKIDYIKKNIWAVATTIRQDAQTMIK